LNKETSTKFDARNDKKNRDDYKISVKIYEHLRVMYLNAGSMLNKLSELIAKVEQEKPDVIGITETWLNSSIEDREINIVGYKIVRQDRVSKIKKEGWRSLVLCPRGY